MIIVVRHTRISHCNEHGNSGESTKIGAAVKLGLFINAQYLPGESMPHKIQESMEQVRAARRPGFDLICAGQHYC